MSPSANPLPAGTQAPDFTLPSGPDATVSLHDYRGQPVILAFYPGDFSPICTDQLGLYQQLLPEFENYDAQLLAISVDSTWSHQAFAEERNLTFPLLADFQPKGQVAQEYGVYNAEKGTTDRALFVIDPEGVIAWSYVSPNGANPGADGILHALDEMKVGAAS
jgi:peroxiredoxin (alkyl hydroperoxide reductase subunit C)